MVERQTHCAVRGGSYGTLEILGEASSLTSLQFCQARDSTIYFAMYVTLFSADALTHVVSSGAAAILVGSDSLRAIMTFI